MTADDDGIVDVTAAARFAGKVLLVTGAGSGLAAATARRYAADGGRVAVLDLDLASAESVAAELEGSVALECDVADEAAVRRAVHQAHDRLGRLDHVVNAAGFAAFTPIEELSLHDWNRMLAVHLTGTFLVCRETLPLLRAAGGGSIVNFASVAALVARPNAAAYAAAKGGIVSFSRQLALDAGADAVRVNVICPGSVQSPMSMAHYGDPQMGLVRPLPPSIQSRIAEADEIAAPVCFLLSDEASFVTGGLFVADGGATAV
jgi:NAD(P)-dependent dehydrogenase (short-subunit alcohol dehydrogenase family)